MKQLYRLLLVLLCLTGTNYAKAQNCIGETRTITTRWDLRWLPSSNKWNWTQSFFNDAYIKNRPQPTTIASPFYTPNTTFQNQNIIFLQNPNVKDNLPNDGWELLVKDFGNGSNLPATAVTNPFFALYNRYTATIRVFFLVSDPLNGTNNGATVSLQFDPTGLNETSLLAHAQPIMNSVGRFAKSTSMRVPNRYTNEQDYWLFADFPVSYDPCTCLFTSRLRFTFELIQSTDVSLNISLEGTSYLKQVIKAQPNGGVNANGSDFSILNAVDGLVSSGVKGYKSYEGFKTAAGGIVDFLSTTNGMNAKQKSELNAFSNVMQLGQTIPYLGGMLGVFDFLMSGGRSDAKSAAPAAFEANLTHKLTGTATGRLDLSIPRGDRIIKNPGSLVDGNAATPTYNNVLGVFALIEKPKVEFAVYEDARTNGTLGKVFANPQHDPSCNAGSDENGYPLCPPPTYFTQMGIYDHFIKQYRLSQDVKYAVNPTSKLTLQDVKFALVVENSTVQFGTAAANFGNAYPYQTQEELFNKMGYEIETNKRFRTPFLPAGCITETSIMVSQSRSVITQYQDPKIYLKVRAILNRSDAGPGVQPVIYVATYEVDVVRSPLDPGNLKFDKFYTPDESSNSWYQNGYYYNYKTPPVLPLPIAGVAGVDNPAYPSPCSRSVPAQTNSELLSFCQDINRYNPRVATRQGASKPSLRQTNGNTMFCTPNPVVDGGKITYTLSHRSPVKLEILDNLGRVVQQLLEHENQVAGIHEVEFNASKLEPGLYHCVIQTAQGRTAIKVVIAK